MSIVRNGMQFCVLVKIKNVAFIPYWSGHSVLPEMDFLFMLYVNTYWNLYM